MNTWQAIIFDMDDTLYAERDYVLSGFRAVAHWAEQSLGIPADQGYAELQALFEQGVRGTTFNQWLLQHQLSDNVIPHCIKVYREHIPIIQPFSWVEPLLQLLQSCVKLGIVSDGYIAVQQRKFAALGLSAYFDEIVFSDELGRENWKPSSKPFQVILQRLNIPANQAVYIGDNPTKDFFGARQIGMYTIQLENPEGEYGNQQAPTLEHAPHLVVNSYKTLQTVLIEEGKKQ